MSPQMKKASGMMRNQNTGIGLLYLLPISRYCGACFVLWGTDNFWNDRRCRCSTDMHLKILVGLFFCGFASMFVVHESLWVCSCELVYLKGAVGDTRQYFDC